jgi:hypothetical protein
MQGFSMNELRSILAPDGSGTAEILSGVRRVAFIEWRTVCSGGVCHEAARPVDVLKLTRQRLSDEQKGGPYASPSKAKAIAMLLQVEAELDGGQKTLDDGTPIFGGSE